MARWMTALEAAEYARISDRTIRSAVKAGDLPAYAIGKGSREYRLDGDDIDTWMKSRSFEPRHA